MAVVVLTRQKMPAYTSLFLEKFKNRQRAKQFRIFQSPGVDD